MQPPATVTDHGHDALAADGAIVRILTVPRSLGPTLDIRRDMGVLEVHVRTDDLDNPALEARNRSAERYSLTPLLAPRAIAVIGAGRRPGGIGHAVLRGLLGGGPADGG